MSLQAIIFDVDGTLAETEEIHRRAFNETFRHFGHDWHWTQADYRALLRVTGGRERIRHFLGLLKIARHHFDDDRIAALHVFKTSRYVTLLRSGTFALRPGIRTLIETAQRRGVTLAIATTTSRANVNCLLDGAFGPSASSLFAAIVCGEDVAAKKPAPDVYLRVLDELKVEAHACVAIEDSRNGLLAARAAGIRVAITPAFYTDHEDFGDADWLFGDGAPTFEALAGQESLRTG